MLKIFKKGYRELTSDVETWVVRWNQRYGEFFGDYNEAVQVFTSKEEAVEFANTLKKANKLLGHTENALTKVKIERMENGF